MIWCVGSAIVWLLLAGTSNTPEQIQQILNQNKKAVQSVDVRYTVETDILVKPEAKTGTTPFAGDSPPSHGLDQTKTAAQKIAEARKQVVEQTPLRQLNKDESPARYGMARRIVCDGRRTYREEIPLVNQAKRKIIYFNDGERNFQFDPGKQMGAILSQPNHYVTWGLNDPRWLITLEGPNVKLIQDSIANNKLRSETMDNGQIHIMAEGPIFGCEIWFDPRVGNLPVRIVEYLRGRMFFDYHDIEYVLTDGGWFPISSLCDAYLPSEPYTLASTKRLLVDQESLIVNGPVSEQILDFKFPSGTTVTDEILGESFVVGVQDVDRHIESLVLSATSMPSECSRKDVADTPETASRPADSTLRNDNRPYSWSAGYMYGFLCLASMVAVMSCLWLCKRKTRTGEVRD